MDYPNILETMYTHIHTLLAPTHIHWQRNCRWRWRPFYCINFEWPPTIYSPFPCSHPVSHSLSLFLSVFWQMQLCTCCHFLFVCQATLVCLCVCLYCYYYCWTLYCVRQITINCNNLHILKVVSKLVSRRYYYVHRVTAICSLSLLVFLSLCLSFSRCLLLNSLFGA